MHHFYLMPKICHKPRQFSTKFAQSCQETVQTRRDHNLVATTPKRRKIISRSFVKIRAERFFDRGQCSTAVKRV